MNVGKRIVELRNAKNLSGYKLAQLAGMSSGSLREIEIGNRTPTTSTLEKICAGLGITTAEFYADPQSSHVTEEAKDDDEDIHEIARARREMTPEQRARMMKIIRASFEEFFGDDKKPT